ncbi:MAG: hypothetical protein CL583_08520 [Alteromonadaceae bacterium]|nr:hypothetical protein [Alteromonadaceae bacterium]
MAHLQEPPDTLAQSIIVDLRISADEWLRLYRGEALDVVARARDGRSVRFPARILRPFVRHDGISGAFLIEFGQDGKFQSVERLG